MSEDNPLHYKPEDDYMMVDGQHQLGLVVLSPAGVAVAYCWRKTGLKAAAGEAVKKSYLMARDLLVEKLKEANRPPFIPLLLDAPDSPDDEAVVVYLGPGASVTVKPWRRLLRQQAERDKAAAVQRKRVPGNLVQLPPGVFGGRG